MLPRELAVGAEWGARTTDTQPSARNCDVRLNSREPRADLALVLIGARAGLGYHLVESLYPGSGGSGSSTNGVLTVDELAPLPAAAFAGNICTSEEEGSNEIELAVGAEWGRAQQIPILPRGIPMPGQIQARRAPTSHAS